MLDYELDFINGAGGAFGSAGSPTLQAGSSVQAGSSGQGATGSGTANNWQHDVQWVTGMVGQGLDDVMKMIQMGMLTEASKGASGPSPELQALQQRLQGLQGGGPVDPATAESLRLQAEAYTKAQQDAKFWKNVGIASGVGGFVVVLGILFSRAVAPRSRRSRRSNLPNWV